jgi:tetratricopeptide (TPR) repeat protein
MPDDAQSQHWYGTAQLGEGRFADAAQTLARAHALNPGSSAIAADAAFVRYLGGDHAGAIAQLRDIARLNPEFSGAHHYLERFYLVEGQAELFLAEATVTARLKRDDARAAEIARAERAYRAGGRAAMLYSLLADAQQRFAQTGDGAITIARIEAARGRREAVLDWLTRAERNREPDIRQIIAYPDFVPYRNDPAFARFFGRR